ncbi:MAG: hypothetical protein WC856_15145 [Methylococcaceae bacterium]|jgi:hypothetical protein
MSSKIVILPNNNRIKISTVPELIANAIYPDGIQVYSTTYFNDNGDPLPADEPCQMRYIVKKRIEKRIRDYFDNGKLELICPIEQAPVLKDYIERTNPFDCLIEFNELVSFATEYGVDVVSEENSVAPLPEQALVDDGSNDNCRRDKQIEWICEIAKQFNYDLLNIPEGGKAAIKTECLKNPRLFTKDSFLKAWVEAGKRNLIRIQNKEKYL